MPIMPAKAALYDARASCGRAKAVNRRVAKVALGSIQSVRAAITHSSLKTPKLNGTHMTANTVQIRQVVTPTDFKAFVEFPWQIYQDDPNWTPPLLSMRYDILDKKKNPAWEYLEGEYFTAWRGEQLVGTIAAFINHRHNEFHNERVGWFGAFETINDPSVAAALLDTAVEWVRSKGYDATNADHARRSRSAD
jgi:hypothetical protein